MRPTPCPSRPETVHAAQNHRPRRQVWPRRDFRDRRRADPRGRRRHPPPVRPARCQRRPHRRARRRPRRARLGPDYALRHPNYRNRRHARREQVWKRIFENVPFDVRAITLGTFLDTAPPGTWAISAGGHFVAYADGFVADSSAWFSRRPVRWFRANPDHGRVALRRVREAVRSSALRRAIPSAARARKGAEPCPAPSRPSSMPSRSCRTRRRRAPAPGFAQPASNTSGTTPCSRISRRSAGSSA